MATDRTFGVTEPSGETKRDHRQDSTSSRTFRRDSKWGLTGRRVLRNRKARQYVATDRTLGVMGLSDETICGD